MKNQLKLAFGIALMSVFSIGCKKDSNKPSAEQTKFTTSSSTFKHGNVYQSQLGNMKSPQLSWVNAPAGTKEFVAIMDDHDKFTYWIEKAPNTSTGFQETKVTSDNEDQSMFSNIPRMPRSATKCTIEVFALNATVDELDKQNLFNDFKLNKTVVTRELFRQTLNKKRAGTILGTASITYKLIQ